MGSLVEIKNINEIYIHYLHTSEADTSDRADSIESQDTAVTINNCAVSLPPVSVHRSDMAVQVDLSDNSLPRSEQEHETTGRTSSASIGGFFQHM